MSYSISSGRGEFLTQGLQVDDDARRAAQATADRLGEPVWLSEDGEDGDGERYEPAAPPCPDCDGSPGTYDSAGYWHAPEHYCRRCDSTGMLLR